MNPQEPSSSPFTLRWRLFGIRFSIAPSFWIMSAIMGWIFLGFGTGVGGSFWVNLVVWVLCTLVSVMVHELGHVLTGRFFGQPGTIALAGLGGQAAGKYERLTPRQRIVVAAAGPGAGFLFLGLQVLFDHTQWNSIMGSWLAGTRWNPDLHWSLLDLDWLRPSWRSDRHYQNAMIFLFVMNLLWNLLNLLPIFPMDGGMILREVCMMISPVGGLKFALGLSLLLAGSVTLYCLLKVAQLYRWVTIGALDAIPSIMEPHFGVLMFGMLAYQNFMLLREVTAAQRTAHYQNQFED